MNERIFQYLLHYAENPDPRYAVMLKGRWGCGKSFFVCNWLDKYKEKYLKGENSLEPIYVSLYGLKETSQITRCIDQVLHPFLYSKGAEFTKKLFKIAGKIVFKTTLDWNKDSKEDVSFDATLDSLSLLSSKDSEFVGTKLLVFDDLERCLIDMKLLLGYINNFVEHGSCHVIIVGDETHVIENAKNILTEFKEKTVGREFEVKPDIDAAITYFLTEDIPLSEWLQNQKELILDVFLSTGCNNLRILRQCLYDFNVLYSEVRKDLLENSNNFMQSLLASYIAVYCDYRSQYHDLFTQWNLNYSVGMFGNDEIKSKIKALQQKYRNIVEKYNFEVLSNNHIPQIVYDIETGYSIKTYVEKMLAQMQCGVNLQERLANFMNMSSEAFEEDCTTLMKDVQKFNVPNMYMFGRSLAILAFFNERCIYWVTQATVSLAKKHIHDNYCKQTEKDELYKLRVAFNEGVSSFGEFYKTFIGRDILEYANNIFDDCDKKLMNKFEIALSNITDENVSQLVKLSGESTPDHQCLYNMTSAFKNIDVEMPYNNICRLSNAGLLSLEEFFSNHYGFYLQLGPGCNRFSEDLEVLTELKSRLEIECKKRKSLDKYVLHRFLKFLDGAVRRANGENGVMNIG